MSALTKIVGLVAGISAVAAIGVSVAQGVPPNPYIANPALGAGQQSSHLTSMGETGVPGLTDPVRTAVVTRAPEVAVMAPAPAPVVIEAQMPAPAPIVEAAPVVVAQVETAPAQTMGAAPSPRAKAKRRAARADRN